MLLKDFGENFEEFRIFLESLWKSSAMIEMFEKSLFIVAVVCINRKNNLALVVLRQFHQILVVFLVFSMACVAYARRIHCFLEIINIIIIIVIITIIIMIIIIIVYLFT